MSDRGGTVQFMRQSAKQLRQLADLQAFLAPQLLKMAEGLDEHADELDAADKNASR